MKMKKAQAAMEFLMTYGWAILVVLVAIGALAYFGVLSPDRFLPEKCVLSSGSGLFCSNFGVDTTANNIRILVKNSLADPVTIAATSKLVEGNTTQCTSNALTIAADSDATLTFSTCGLASGDKIKWDVAIDYTVGGFSKTATGTLITRAP